jgi:TonB family protein
MAGLMFAMLVFGPLGVLQAIADDSGVPPLVAGKSGPPDIVPPMLAPGQHNLGAGYPPQARRRGEQGVTQVMFTVREDGSVSSPSVVKSSGFADIDNASLQSVTRWIYRPALKDGKPIAVRVVVNVKFQLTRGDEVPPGMPYTQLDMSTAIYPADALAAREEGNTVLGVTVQENGHIGDMHIMRTSGFPSLDQASMSRMTNYNFVPATMDGKPVKSVVMLILNWQLPLGPIAGNAAANSSSGTITPPTDYTPPARDGSQDSEGVYPPEARAHREQGRAQIDFTVRKDGTVADPSLVGSTGFADLDMAAIQTIEARHYKPATVGGKPVEAHWRDYVDFALAGVAVPPGVIPPRLDGSHDVDSFYPASARFHHEEGRVLVIFTVQQDGSVSDPFVQQSSGYGDLDDAAIQAVKTWRYLPATKDGKPVAIQFGARIGFHITSCDSLRC